MWIAGGIIQPTTNNPALMDVATTTSPDPTMIKQHPELTPQGPDQGTLEDTMEGRNVTDCPSDNTPSLTQTEREHP